MPGDDFGNLFPDGAYGVQACHWILKHHGNLLAAHAKPFCLCFILCQILPAVKDFPTGHGAVLIQHSNE